MLSDDKNAAWLTNTDVFVDDTKCGSIDTTVQLGDWNVIKCAGTGVKGATIKLMKKNATEQLGLCGIRVYESDFALRETIEALKAKVAPIQAAIQNNTAIVN